MHCPQCSREITPAHRSCFTCLERTVMAHRYLYYILNSPVLADIDYDSLERSARAVLPPTSPVHQPGSSLPEDYAPDVIHLARALC